jgi:hypothetical protein
VGTGPLRDLRKLGSQLPRGPVPTEVRRLAREAEAVIDERNRITHSILTLGGQDADGSWKFALLHPRKAVPFEARHDALPTAEELRLLEARTTDLMYRVMNACPTAWAYLDGLGGT